MSSSYFTNESLKSGWKDFHDKFVGDDKPVFNFDNVPIDTIKKNLEISSDPYDFHKLIITKTESKDKNNLWIYRNLLFYRILQEIIITLSPGIKDICKYKISNFGSTNVTSDIDACIQYDGDGTNQVSTVIQAIEDYYVSTVGIPCLRLDIEFYDSYISKCQNPITECGKPCSGVESYTVDFSDSVFDEDAFQKMLPYAFASMIRNVFIAVAEHIPCYQGRCTEQINPSEKIVPVSDENKPRWTELFKQISDIDSVSSFEELKNIVVELSDIGDLITKIKEFCKVCLPEYNYPDQYNLAVTLVTEYFNTNPSFDYNKQRNLYYGRLEKAEKLISSSNNTEKITAFSESQIFRQEGYVCVSTVIHVPRYMQQCNSKTDSICNTTDCNADKETKPFCLLNDYAYKLSMIEQIGFMLRFAISNIINNNFTDTNIENNNTYFDGKITKYKERWTDAKGKLKPPTQGGKRKHRNTRKTRKTKKSQKNRKRSRKNKRINI